MRILLANPNTSQSVTDTIAEGARRAVAPGTSIHAVTAGFGARVIGTRTEMAVAEHACLDLLAREAPGMDAVIIGASIDSGLRAAREMLDVPVLGLTESALHVATLVGGRIGAVVLSVRSLPVLREMIEAYGFIGRLAGVAAVASGPLDLLERPDVVAESIAAAACALVERDGAEAIVLIGAVMAAMPARVQPRVPVPVIEGVGCAVGLAEMLIRLRLPKPGAGSYAALPAREQVGIGDALAARFSPP